ncbi:hypothetical protein JRO89_XS05G0010200 [Xanthoceras sorbifolium]|uniref:HTH myb-type domain-containing protein n=1 Tax=Xanthoceras sorbifolium TaxID=99658 RepID=A0ABQ8HZS4_9ROSI|nr:hypothetical protein JRO89_XS05G0010200 [Xanthoceras sorbifolium]
MDMDVAQKMQRCHEYVEALEEEKRKIQVFQRELPLCLELVTQAIEACKKELSGATTTEYMQGQSECSEQTSSDAPVLEEFIPLKRTCSSQDNDEEHSHEPTTTTNTSDKKKSDWLRSVQLWNQSPDPPPKEDLPRKTAVVEVKRNGGAFQPFHREKSAGKTDQSVAKPISNPPVPAAATSSTTETVSKGSAGNSKREDKESQSSQRKQRRCWSPELHRRFLHALQQLGGSHAATPKQIRELMKVDGLTNDEVKSHLQKYRLHTRRPSQSIHNNTNPQAPQFVVVGGIWVPPPEYAAVTSKSSGEATSMARGNGIYAPMAAPPPTVPQSPVALMQRSQSEHLQSEEGGNHSEGGMHSSSPATSSSTHTTTTSPAL